MAVLEEPIKGRPTSKNYINGEWVESKGEMIDVVNPATNQMIGGVCDPHRPSGSGYF